MFVDGKKWQEQLRNLLTVVCCVLTVQCDSVWWCRSLPEPRRSNRGDVEGMLGAQSCVQCIFVSEVCEIHCVGLPDEADYEPSPGMGSFLSR